MLVLCIENIIQLMVQLLVECFVLFLHIISMISNNWGGDGWSEIGDGATLSFAIELENCSDAIAGMAK